MMEFLHLFHKEGGIMVVWGSTYLLLWGVVAIIPLVVAIIISAICATTA